MSIFSFVGNIGKTIGKVALGAVGAATGIGGLATVFDKKTNQPPSNAAASLAIAPANYDSQNAGGGSLLGSITNFLNGAGNWFSGRTHAQVDANVGAGGRVNDLTQSALPPWLIPAGIVGAILLLVMGKKGGGGRRY